MKKLISSFFGAVLALVVVYSVSAQNVVPLPGDIKIVAPSEQVAPNLAKFSGKWTGAWDGVMNHVLVVEGIEGDKVNVVYAFGAYAPWNITKGNWTRVEGQFDGRAVTVKFRNGASAVYVMDGDQISGTYIAGPTRSVARMIKQ